MTRVLALWLTAVFLVASPSHGQQLTQYAHTAWRFQEGVFDASPVSMAQTTDGFLWIGTLNGLIRFDGVHFESWNDRLHDDLHTCCALSLLGSSDGSLWIGTGTGLARLKDGKLSAVSAESRYNRIIEDRTGRIWAARTRIRDGNGPLCEVDGTRVQCHGERDGLGCRFGNALAQDKSGTVWVGDEGRVCSWHDGAAATFAPPVSDTPCKPGIESLFADVDDSLVIGCEGGLRRLENGRFVPFQSASIDADRLKGSHLLRDRSGALWIGTNDDGLYHIANGIADHFGVGDGLSGDNVSDLFEDHEGNVWVVTPDGVDRFHRLAVLSLSREPQLRGVGGSAVLASRDGRTIWTSGIQGLGAIRDGAITMITRKEGLPGQQVTALFEDRHGVLWIGVDQDLVTFSNGRFRRILRRDGRSTGMVVGMAEDADESIWIVTAASDDRFLRFDPKTAVAEVAPQVQAPNFVTSDDHAVYVLSYLRGEISILQHGDVPEHAPVPTGPRTARALLPDDDGSLFVGTDVGLYRWKQREWSGLTVKNGLPCDAVQDVTTDRAGGLWLRLACGIVNVTRGDVDAWARDPAIRLDLKLYDAFDGARPGLANFEPRHATDANGRLWFANGSVLQMIDPETIARNELPPPVHILRVVADRKTAAGTANVRLPALTHELEIDYAALSLVSPDKVRFRYALWGVDKDWQDAGSRREAYYMNLPPGHYQFQVIAANNDGVWNRDGDRLDFTIAPAYYQTKLFRALVVFAALAFVWGAYRWRLRRLRHAFQITLDARVNERMRIARELHDTLLQSFQGALLRFQAVANALATRPSEARERLERALDQAEAALTEGRDAVQGLRASAVTVNDLANGIAAAGADLTSAPSVEHPPVVTVEVDGASRDLNPVVREEAYRIATEALRNAVKHAQASQITVTIHYELRQLRLTVRDDGRGIDPETIRGDHRAGHFGLPGMRERAAIVGGQLDVRTQAGAGTTIELHVPAAVAYGTSRASWWSRLVSRTATEV